MSDTQYLPLWNPTVHRKNHKITAIWAGYGREATVTGRKAKSSCLPQREKQAMVSFIERAAQEADLEGKIASDSLTLWE